MGFFPVSQREMENSDAPDFVLITGDAYVDHPSFGAAVIGRIVESLGYSVGVIARPDIRKDSDFTQFRKPRLGFLITSGNIDSMVINYTVARKKRDKDVYAPGGVSGNRPDRALTEYSKKIRKLYKDSAIILGGVEASLRRLAHYDYWADKIMPSVLLESKADLLVYGMGELQITEIAHALNAGCPVSELTYIRGTAYRTGEFPNGGKDHVMLPSYEELRKNGGERLYAQSFVMQHKNMDYIVGKTLIEPYDGCFVVVNPPTRPLETKELDAVNELPYMRDFHPSYAEDGGIPALDEVKFGIIVNRGCFGSCNFCALTHHQGRVIQKRSEESIVREAEILTKTPGFKGYIHDVGGPTANFRLKSCKKQEKYGMCADRKCLSPKPCKELIVDHGEYLSILRRLRGVKGVKKVFIRSGIRFDYLIYDKNEAFFRELVEHHISGQLKVAPEHISGRVLERMGKPPVEVYNRFLKRYYELNDEYGKKQFVVPYLMSSHPGSTLTEAVELAEYLRDNGISPRQVQDFYPTPSSVSTCMYYTGIDPFTQRHVYSAKSPHEKAMQRALIQYRLPQNYDLVYEALKSTNRLDLVGFDKKCLIRPRNMGSRPFYGGEKPVKASLKPKKKKTIRNVHAKKHV